MRTFYADLHVHIGRSGGQPVKIAASPRLTLPAVIEESVRRKGIHIVGLVDAVTDPVFGELEEAAGRGRLEELADGGLTTPEGKLMILPGAELEVQTGGKAAHYLAFMPSLDSMARFRSAIKPHVTNLSLSSQVVRLTLAELVEKVVACGGVFMLAHAFTPHKGYYGNCAGTLTEHLSPREIGHVAGIELGLSSDSSMADRLAELHAFPFVSNSDAHSLENIAREYNALRLAEPTLTELRMALAGKGGRRILANYGLDPRLGKYYKTFCPTCVKTVPLRIDRLCPRCDKPVVPGVYDRLLEIADTDGAPQEGRPPYVHQVPLRFIPGLGPAGITKLVDRFGTHMEILHRASFEDLAAVVGEKIAHRIVQSREGKLAIRHGAGGSYGRLDG